MSVIKGILNDMAKAFEGTEVTAMVKYNTFDGLIWDKEETKQILTLFPAFDAVPMMEVNKGGTTLNVRATYQAKIINTSESIEYQTYLVEHIIKVLMETKYCKNGYIANIAWNQPSEWKDFSTFLNYFVALIRIQVCCDND